MSVAGIRDYVTEYVDLSPTSDPDEPQMFRVYWSGVNFSVDFDSSFISEDIWVDIREKMRKRKEMEKKYEKYERKWLEK